MVIRQTRDMNQLQKFFNFFLLLLKLKIISHIYFQNQTFNLYVFHIALYYLNCYPSAVNCLQQTRHSEITISWTKTKKISDLDSRVNDSIFLYVAQTKFQTFDDGPTIYQFKDCIFNEMSTHLRKIKRKKELLFFS